MIITSTTSTDPKDEPSLTLSELNSIKQKRAIFSDGPLLIILHLHFSFGCTRDAYPELL